MTYTEKDLNEIYQDCLEYTKNCESWDYEARDAYLQDIGRFQITEPDEQFKMIVSSDVFHDACGKIISFEEDKTGKLISVTVTTDY